MSSSHARVVSEALDVARTVLLALAIALALRVALVQPFTIVSSSMEPGLVTGDYVLAAKWPYGWSRASVPFNPPAPHGRLLGAPPRRGDVMLFRLPRAPREIYVKRLIGLPGDRVQVVGGAVFVNGRPIPRQPLGPVDDHDAPGRIVPQVREIMPDDRRYLTYAAQAGHAMADTGVYRVPAGSYFFMGDNRDNSLDSRWPAEVGVGFVPAENLVGKAELVLLSWKAGASILKPWTWLDLDPRRFFKPIR
jgi:signal peptidase I